MKIWTPNMQWRVCNSDDAEMNLTLTFDSKLASQTGFSSVRTLLRHTEFSGVCTRLHATV